MKKIILLTVICAISIQAHSQSWKLTGNSGTNSSTNFIGTTDNVAFKMRTNNSVRIAVSGAGKVGIGVTSPVGKLHVKGNSNVSQLIIDANSTQSSTNPLIKLRNSSGTDLLWIHSDDASNSFVGVNAGSLNNATGGGTSNTFTGVWAGFSNTTGNSNTASGQSALFFNTEGNSNTAYGEYSLTFNTTGYFNTAIGAAALYSNTTGTYNTAFGYDALVFNKASGNTANGYTALHNDTTGYSNTASGTDALYFNTVGSSNTANGYQTLYHNTTGNINIATGVFALYSTTFGSGNTADGYSALISNTKGDQNTAIGANALFDNTTGNFNSGIGAEANSFIVNYSNSTAIGSGSNGNATNKIRIGSSSVTVVEGQVAYSPPSDGRFKENIKNDVKGLEFILKLQPVSYNFNRLKFARHIKENITTDREKTLMEESQNRSVGFIAQDVEKIIQQTGFTSFDAVHAPTNETDNYSLGYEEFVVPLVKAVQELSKENDDLKSEVEILKSEVRSMKSENQILAQRIEKLEALLSERILSTHQFITSSPSLEQNSPNPFSEKTTIHFQVPSSAQNSELKIFSADGKELKSFIISTKGKEQIEINANYFSPGIYNYTLMIDGKAVDSKQMILTK